MRTNARIGHLFMLFAIAGVVACSTPQQPAADGPSPAATETAPPAPAPQPIAATDPRAAAPNAAAQPATQFPSAGEHSTAALTYRIIDAPNGTFGYDILSDGRLFVHQTNLPGMPGNDGCTTKADAEKLAAFVIGKIQRGEMPPSVTPEELKELNIR